MASTESKPFIVLGDGNKAPILNYSIPDATSYSIKSSMALNIENDYFQNLTPTSPEIGNFKPQDFATLGSAQQFVREQEHPENFRIIRSIDGAGQPRGARDSVGPPYFSTYTVISIIKKVPPASKINGVVFIVEKLQVSNFLGNYGAGKVINTFSLFPGEKTTISIKTFNKSENKSKNATTILDSVSSEATEDFKDSLTNESQSKESSKDAALLTSFDAHAEGEGMFGLVQASASLKMTGELGTVSLREGASKNVSEAVRNHAQRQSAKRNLEVNQVNEIDSITSTETSITREIQNINVSRTLNLVFRQMNQEYISVVHLVDTKIVFFDIDTKSYFEYNLFELDKFINKHIKNDETKRAYIKNKIIEEIDTVFDNKGEVKSFIENFKHTTVKGSIIDYWRVKKEFQEPSQLSNEHPFIKVKGIVLSEQILTLRTDGVIVDAILGQGNALDDYSQGLQTEAVREKRNSNEKMELAKSIVENGEIEKAKLFEQVYPCCQKSQMNTVEINPAK